jgi:hypothetical protein
MTSPGYFRFFFAVVKVAELKVAELKETEETEDTGSARRRGGNEGDTEDKWSRRRPTADVLNSV